MQWTPSERERAQRRALRRNRVAATTLLVGMAATFVATASVGAPGFWIALLHSAAEAGVVGGLADWFAVTAVFRRPLGLPIPHTAIVARNKDRIGEGLGAFLERHFLTDELLLSKLRELDLAQRLARWLAQPANAKTAAEWIMGVLPHLTAPLADEELRKFTGRVLGIRLRDVDLAPLLGKAITLLTAGGYHAAVLDQLLEFASDFLNRNAERLEDAAAGARRRWWIPAAVNKQIARAILKGVQEMLDDLRRPETNMRRKALAAIDALARDLVSSPEYRAKVEKAKLHLLDRPEIQQWLGAAWDQVRDALHAAFADPSSQTSEWLAAAISSLGRSLLADESMRVRLNGRIEATIAGLLPWRSELARFIAEVVRRWDEKVFVQRMELALGADLQYVRFTGTLVGAAVGCLLFLLSHLLAGINP
jgi:uncharacterized membrane-anchored protein YjiN (DUF445 family)